MGQCLLCFVETEFLLSCSHWSYRNDPPALLPPPPVLGLQACAPYTVSTYFKCNRARRMAQWVRALVSRLSSSHGTHMVDKTDSHKLSSDLWEHIMTCVHTHAQKSMHECNCVHAYTNACAYTHTNTYKRLNYMCSWWQIRLKIPNST